ncbi:MAG: hypothetical protein WBA00_11325 [Rhodococcus sp. (in: high G+C Gram-positive bacteria)]
MALHFALQVNGKSIGYFEAVRVAGTDHADSIGTYRVLIRKHPTPQNPAKDYRDIVEHRFGDGAWSLLSAAIRKAGLE